MNSLIRTLALTGLILCGTQAFADDSMTQATMTDHQKMKDCIEKQKQGNVNMSTAEMKRVCKDEMKKQKATGEVSPPPTDTPHD